MMLLLGVFVVLAVIVAVVAAVVMAARSAREESPPSRPDDFVAPSSGNRGAPDGYAFRQVDETPEAFRARTTSRPPPA